MARIRTIKPQFWVSEQIADCSTSARLLFIGLWNFCDDNGVHPAKHRTLKGELFPLDDISVDAVAGWVAELIKAGLIAEYEADGARYWHVTGWTRHQRIDRPSAMHPLPPSQAQSKKFDEPSPTTCPSFDEDSTSPRRAPPPGREGNGEEGNGEEITPIAPKGANANGKATKAKTEHPLFAEFYTAYPRKVARPAALKAFSALNPDRELLSLLLAAIAEQQRNEQWCRDGGRYVPHPATWLNNRRWEDRLGDRCDGRRRGSGSASDFSASDYEVGATVGAQHA